MANLMRAAWTREERKKITGWHNSVSLVSRGNHTKLPLFLPFAEKVMNG